MYSKYCPDDIKKEKLFTEFLDHKKNVLLLGAGGTGKSYTIEEVKNYLNKTDLKYYVLGTTGISSVNIGGQTLHRWSGTGIDTKRQLEVILEYVKAGPKKENWLHTDLLIIDEISMLGQIYFDILDYIGRKLRNSDELFGGIQLLLCGDLLQLPPVNDNWIFKSPKFKNFVTISFTEPKRYPDLNYFALLQRLRYGETTEEDYALLYTRFKEYFKIDIDKMEIKPTILYSKNVDVKKINQEELDKLKTPKISNFARDKKEDSKGIIYSIDKKENLIDNNSIPDYVEFKIGAQVILKINYDVDLGLCNGSRGVVVDINKSSNEIRVKFQNEQELWFKPHDWKSKVDDITYIRSQFPFILGYAVTVHGCQGMTLDCAIVDLGYSIFLPAQAYVALSRVRTLEGLYISKISEKSFFADAEAVEYVKKIFKNVNWVISADFDEEDCTDFLKCKLKNRDVIISANNPQFMDFFLNKKIETKRLCRNPFNLTEEKLYNLYYRDLPNKIFIFCDDQTEKLLEKLKNIIDDKLTKIIEW